MLNWIKNIFKPEEVLDTQWVKKDLMVTTNKGKYRGSCTVWYSYPDGRRQGTFKEAELCNVWQKAVWEKEGG